ncbi:MAG TPA: hypothetical protein VGN52_11700 [Burkholderiales bacterium]|jgi:predicted lipoprotein with Yx(FWY)xxD motif
MKMTRIALAAAAALLSVSAFAAPQTKMEGGVMVGANNMTLYTFDKDTAGSGKSVCNGPCLANWPALMATDSDKAAGDYSIVTRDDGKKQWAYKGRPLYYFVKDQKPGDKVGEGAANGAWHVAK